MKTTFKALFYYIADLAGLAESEIELIINSQKGMKCISAEVIDSADEPEGGFECDCEFTVEAEIEFKGNYETALKQLSEISEFAEACAEALKGVQS